MSDMSYFLINYSVGSDSDSPVTTFTSRAKVPDFSTTINGMISSIQSNLSSKFSELESNLNILLSSLMDSTSSMTTEESEMLNSEYEASVNHIILVLRTRPSSKPTKSQQDNAKRLLSMLSQKFLESQSSGETTVDSDPRITGSRVSSDSVTRVKKDMSLSGLSNNMEMISQQIKVLAGNDKNLKDSVGTIGNTLASKMGNYGNLKDPDESQKVPVIVSEDPSENKTETINNLVEKIKSALSTSGAEDYLQGAMDQIKANAETDSSRAESLIDFVKNLLSNGEEGITKMLDDLKNIISSGEVNTDDIQIPTGRQRRRDRQRPRFLTSRSRQRMSGGNEDRETTDNLNALLKALEAQQSGITDSYNKKKKDGKVSKSDVDKYLSDLSESNFKINALKKQIRDSGGRVDRNQTGIPKMISDFGYNIGNGPIGGVTKSLFSGRPYDRGLSLKAKRNLKSQLEGKDIVEPNVTFTEPESVEGMASKLDVYTSINGSVITVYCSGVLKDSSFSCSFNLDGDLLKFVATEAFISVWNMSDSAKSSLCMDYGVEPSSPPTESDVWNSYLVFVFSYLSVLVYSFLYQGSALDLEMPESEMRNVFFFLKPRQVTHFGNMIIPISSVDLEADSKAVLSVCIARVWPSAMYGGQKDDILSDGMVGLTIAKVLNKIYAPASENEA